MRRDSTDELRICGMPQAFACERAVGRLRFFCGDSCDCERAIVCFERPEGVREALALLDLRRIGAPAAVLCPCDTPDSLLGALFGRGLPYFILPDSRDLSRALEGRLALLDGRSGELVIDPQLDTLCRYRASGERASAFRISRALCYCDRTARGEELFELTASAIERASGAPMTVAVCSSAELGEERFCECAEAVLRAAVYGNVSLMLFGALSGSELERDAALLHACFCRLLKEGREFDGYLPRGILIDAPMLLLAADSLPRCDFFCFDLDALLLRLTGRGADIDGRRVRSAMLDFWRDWRERNGELCRSRELRAVCASEAARGLLWEWCEVMGISEVYIEGGFDI